MTDTSIDTRRTIMVGRGGDITAIDGDPVEPTPLAAWLDHLVGDQPPRRDSPDWIFA